jgi:hypothetical protein
VSEPPPAPAPTPPLDSGQTDGGAPDSTLVTPWGESIPTLDSNPFITGERAASVEEARAKLVFDVDLPISFGDPTAIYLQGASDETQEGVAYYFEHPNYGPFRISLFHAPDGSEDVYEEAVKVHNSECDVGPDTESSDPCKQKQGIKKLVQLPGGKTALLSAIVTPAGDLWSGGLIWLDRGVEFVLEIAPPGEFTEQKATEIASQFPTVRGE